MSDSIFSMDKGTGDAVVLISGLGGLSSFWDPVVQQLSTTSRVISLDHPGVGRSSIEGMPTIAGIAQAVLAILDEKGIEKADIVGHSTGSLVAQTLALDARNRVRSIVLSSGWAKPDKRFEDFFAYRKFVLKHLGGKAYDALTKLTAYPSEWYGDKLAKAEPLDLEEPSSLNVEMVQARIDMLLHYNRYNELACLDVPVLVVGAEDDYVIPFHHSQELARLIPGAHMQALNGGHFAPVTRTDAYVTMLIQFLLTAR